MTARSTLRATTAALLLYPLAPALAQEAALAIEPEASESADEIIVTARRRSEDLQDVPVAVSVLGAAQLETTGTYNITRLTQLQPTLQFYSSNPRNSAINIRGIGAPFGLTNDGIEQGVGLYIDQVYYSRAASASFDFIDIEQIEVLRGPQGTLYGKNTTAGAVNITTRKPSFTPEARFELTGGNLDFIQAKGSVSGPLIGDVLAGRFAITGTSRRGTIFNTTTQNYVNEQRNLGFKGSLLFTGIDGLDLTFYADYNRQNAECCTQVFARVAPTRRSASRQFDALIAALGYEPPSRNAFDRLTDIDSDLQAKQDFGGVSLLAEYDIGGGTLTSVSAWRFWDWRPASDRDFLGIPITTISANPSNQRQISQEFRYSSKGGETFDYVIGIYGYRQTINTAGAQEQGSAASLFLLGPTTGNNPALLDGLRQDVDIRFDNNSLAAFGQLTWNITDTLRLQPGLRLNYDTKDASYNAVVSGGLANPTPAQLALQRSILAPQSYVARYRDFNVSYDVNLAWEPAQDVLVYASYARAFKSGGINLSGLPTDAAGNPALSVAEVAPEKVDHYEIGVKSQFWGKRATLNLTAFRTDIQDFQTTVTNGQIGVVRGYLANADVRSQGIEADLSLRPVDWFSSYVSIAYTDAEYTDFPDAPPPIELSGGSGAQLVPFVDISGQELPGVSKWAVSWGAEATLPLPGDGGREFYAGTDASYRSSFSSTATPSAFTRVDGYALVNFRLGYRTDDGFNVFGWMRNAFNRDYFEFLSLQPGNNGLIVGQVGDPRTYGITVSKKF